MQETFEMSQPKEIEVMVQVLKMCHLYQESSTLSMKIWYNIVQRRDSICIEHFQRTKEMEENSNSDRPWMVGGMLCS